MGVWSSLILQNGAIDQVEARLEAENLGGRVTYYDQGYSDIVESLDGYTRVSRMVLLVGLALWAVVLAAYCVLLPMQESKTACVCGHWARNRRTSQSRSGRPRH